MSPAKIIQAILDEFKELECTETSGWKQDQWTKAVPTALCCVGHRFGYIL